MSAAEKTERIMGALMDHLRAKYQLLSSSNVFRLQTNAAGTLTLILDLLSPKVDGADSDATKFGGDINDIQFLRDVNCGLQYLPTFQIVFTPMAIVSDQDSPPPSSRTLFNVLLVNYQVRNTLNNTRKGNFGCCPYNTVISNNTYLTYILIIMLF